MEIDNGTVQYRGLLRILLFGTTGSLPSGYGENTYTRGATLSEHCVQEHPQAGNHNDQAVDALRAGSTQQQEWLLLHRRAVTCDYTITETRQPYKSSTPCGHLTNLGRTLPRIQMKQRNVEATSLITAEQIETKHVANEIKCQGF